MNGFVRREGATVEFHNLRLVDEGDTYVYAFDTRPEGHGSFTLGGVTVQGSGDSTVFFETVADPTERELLDSALSAWGEVVE